MFQTNLKILLTVVGTLAVYTVVANVIPQVRSAVPEDITLTADMSPEELAGIGEELYNGAGGCTACHGLGTRAPDLLGVAGTVCETRVPDQGCKQYLWESLVEPTAYIVEGFQPIMLDQSRLLTEPQLWALVAFLESQGGEITVTPDDFAAALAAEEAAPAEGAGATGAGGTGEAEAGAIDPRELIVVNGCMACHSFEGEGAAVGPPFEDLRGMDPEYIRRGIVEPNADTAADYAAFAGTMPPTFGQMLSEAELNALVTFFATGETPSPSGGGEPEEQP